VEDPLPELFSDKSIDVETGLLLGRYIAMERDSERQLRERFDDLEPAGQDGGQAPINLADIYAQLDRLTRMIEDIKTLAGPHNN
jgi:hypothetical protein